MTTTLGRATIGDPHGGTIRQQGNRLTFTADIEGTSVDDCQAKMQQLAGMLDNPDEEVFPFTCGEDTTFDGFYRVRNLTLSPVAVYLATGLCPFTVELERVPTFATPVFELVVGSVVRTNSHGVTAPYGFITSWYSGASYTIELGSTVATVGPITTEDGSMSIASLQAPASVRSIQSYLKPADAYKCQARVEVKYGSTWYPVVGHQIPLAVGLNWRISNGLCRMYPTNVGGHGRFTVERYDGGSWSISREFGVMSDSTTFIEATANASDVAFTTTILRNSPEGAVVATRSANRTFTWALQRGAVWVELSLTDSVQSLNFGVGCSTATSSTSFTGGVRRSSTNNRYLISCPSTVTADTTNGRLNLSSTASSAQFQIMPDYYASDTLGADTAPADTWWRDAFLAARMERQRIVPR